MLPIRYLKWNRPHFELYSNKILHNVSLRGQAGRFIDKVCSGEYNHESIISHFDLILQGFEEDNIKVDCDKLLVGLEIKPFLRFLLCRGWLHIDLDKLEAISHFIPPTTCSHLRAFLGQVGYNCQFVKGFTFIAHPIYQFL